MSNGSVWESERGTFIKTVVRPNSKSKKFVVEITSEAVFVNISSPAREGKANVELVKRMAKTLGISAAEVTIVVGHKTREKILVVSGMSQEAVIQKISNMI
jgi:uncharacterized protein (TIGR00251 family)